MEKIIDFDTWIKNYVPQKIKYVAVFDPMTGTVQSVGPEHAFQNVKNKVIIDSETAESVINGEIKISSCIVNLISNSFEISETHGIVKIFDDLHRIIDMKYSEVEKNDLFLTYNRLSKTLDIQISEEYGGTRKLPDQFQPVQPKTIVWDGDKQMDFLVTDYNDPNLLFDVFSVKINELKGKTYTIDNFDYEKFSIFTRRLFKNYVIEIL